MPHGRKRNTLVRTELSESQIEPEIEPIQDRFPCDHLEPIQVRCPRHHLNISVRLERLRCKLERTPVPQYGRKHHSPIRAKTQ
mmetsp:Transcript_20257/g.45797  ORF Transcript_20257/g.45797 Transcript_20257/m.45797 type:complete len:83 (-) Transcript_20257:59-307(-)